MWVLLEYNQQRMEESQGAAREHGINLYGVFREDQLSSLDPSSIELILVGNDWSAQTIHRLRQRGVKAPVVCVVDALTPDARDRAQNLDAVDIVTYPLSFTYLTMWGKSTASVVQQEAPTELQKILGESGRLKRKQTYTLGNENNQEEIDALGQQTRARILFVHGRKGHIGKSTIVSLLANQFAASGLDVAVVDFDVSGDLAHRYGVQAHVSLREWAKLPTHMDERMVKHSLVQAGEHLFLLPSSGQENTKQDEPTVKKIIYHLATHMDVVLIDAGPEWTPQTETLLTLSHRVIYVMTSNFSSVRAYLDGYDAVLNIKGDARRIVPIVSVASRTSEQKKVLHVLAERFDSLFVLGYDRLLYKQLIHQLPMTGGKKTQATVQGLAIACGIETTRRVKRVRKPIRAKKSSALAYVGMASAVAAGVVAVVLMNQISHTETIVVTSKYLAPYETVTAQDVHTVTVPDSVGISGLATNMNQVVGTYLTFPIPKGYPVTAGDTSTSNSYSQFLTEYTDKTHQQGVMVSFTSNSPEAGLVTPGTTIALVVPAPNGGGGFQTVGPVEVLGMIHGSPPTLLLFVPTSQYETIMHGVLANNVSVEMIPQTGTFTLASDTQSMTIGQPIVTRPLVAHVTVDSTRHPKGA